MFNTLFIDWNPDVVAFHLGPFAVRWYSLCWCIGLLSVYMLMHRMFREQDLKEEQFDPASLSAPVWVIASSMSRNISWRILWR